MYEILYSHWAWALGALRSSPKPCAEGKGDLPSTPKPPFTSHGKAALRSPELLRATPLSRDVLAQVRELNWEPRLSCFLGGGSGEGSREMKSHALLTWPLVSAIAPAGVASHCPDYDLLGPAMSLCFRGTGTTGISRLCLPVIAQGPVKDPTPYGRYLGRYLGTVRDAERRVRRITAHSLEKGGVVSGQFFRPRISFHGHQRERSLAR